MAAAVEAMAAIDRRVWAALAATAALLLLCLTRNPAVRPEIDLDQPKSGSISLPLTPRYRVGQTFVALHPNLAGVEVYPALYGAASGGARVPGRLILHLRSEPDSSQDLATGEIDGSHLQTDQPARFTFAPLPDSQGKSYYLLLEGSPDNQAGVLYSQLDVYAPGQLYFGGKPAEADLRFTTLYRYDIRLMASDAAYALAHQSWLAFPLAALLFVPGCLLLTWLRPGVLDADILSGLALALGLSLAVTPLGMLWLTALGLRLSQVAALVISAVASLAAVIWLLARRRKAGEPGLARSGPAFSGHGAVGVALLALVLLVRLLQIHALVVPLWADSIHHTLITRLIMQTGQIPGSYRPFFPSDSFFYHFGFHVQTAWLAWLSGLPVTQSILILGQVLNAGAALAAYLLAARLSGRRAVGLAAMAITGLVAVMPAYYVNWGRYTLLAGVIILPVAVSLSLGALQAGQRTYRTLVLAALAWAGLFVTHYSAFAFGVAFLILYLLAALLLHRDVSTRSSTLLWRSGALACMAGIWLAPWLVRLFGFFGWPPRTLPGRVWLEHRLLVADLSSIAGGADWIVTGLAVAGLLLGLYRRQRWVALVGLWMVLLWTYANAYAFGLPTTWVMETFTARISLFLPQVILAGYLVISAFDFTLVQSQSSLSGLGLRGYLGWRGLLALAVSLPLAVGCLRNVPASINPAVVLATPDDLPAMEWIRHNVAADALFLVNMRPWTSTAYMGEDGGSWIQMLTDRPTTWPSLNYTLGTRELYYGVNGLAGAMQGARSMQEPTLRAWINTWQVDYVYIGAKGGRLTPQMLLAEPGYRQVYTNGAVWIFQVHPPPHEGFGLPSLGTPEGQAGCAADF